MNPVLALGPRLRRAEGRDGRVRTGVAVAASALTTVLTTSVLAVTLAFAQRAAHPAAASGLDHPQVRLASAATVLLAVALVVLGAAAARLGAGRRDERIATLRLLGATPHEVLGLTAVESASHGLVGAVLGSLLYGALLPVWAAVAPPGAFTVAELWVGPSSLALVGAGVVLLAAVSGVVTVRRTLVGPPVRRVALAAPRRAP
ncbi:FtsX-like permease family protein [Cellulomonas sp. CW35]|uniref:FtsX-like permease family protein n=1 Tax=Cellulomonas sp. CW35 TaxID=3458249 RepID=UPI004034DF82